GIKLHSFQGHTKLVVGFLLIEIKKQIISWSCDTTIILWDLTNLNNQNNHFIFKGHLGQICNLIQLNNTNHYISWSHDKTIILWDLTNKNNQTNHLYLKVIQQLSVIFIS